MKYLVTGTEMKLLEQNTADRFKVTSELLMEQAAGAFVRKLLSYKEPPQRVLVVCGFGNNGGDGIAIARLLNQSGIYACICLCGDDGKKGSPLYRRQLGIYRAYRYPETECIGGQEVYDCVIDAVFGTGLSRKPEGAQLDAINAMNRMGGKKIAVDMPSGVSADSGEVFGAAFRADGTYTFAFAKTGQFLWPGSGYTGELTVLPIGVTKESFLEQPPSFAMLEDSDLSLLPRRIPHSNKGTYGKLLVIAGSTNMAGAAYFSAKAAYRMGCGLVKIYTPVENRTALQTMIPEAVLSTYGAFEPESLKKELAWADAVVMGPGLGMSDTAGEIVRFVINNCKMPLLLDADAVNLVAAEQELLQKPHTDIVITPHLGELSRLMGETVPYLQTHLAGTAAAVAGRYGVVCVAKEEHTATALPHGMTYLNVSGNNGMATAGSGDVLSGIIGALLAQSVSVGTAAPLGVYLHGRAGDFAGEIVGMRAMTAGDILDGLTGILCHVE